MKVSGTAVTLTPFPSGEAEQGRYQAFSDASRDEEETRRLLSNRSFRALIQMRLGFWIHAEEEYEAGRAAVDEILSLISSAQAQHNPR